MKDFRDSQYAAELFEPKKRASRLPVLLDVF